MASNGFFNIESKFKQQVDDVGRLYIFILFGSAVIWSFIAINNLDTPSLFKTSLIYSILLIFAFIGLGYDKSTHKLGLDSRIWSADHLKRKLAVSLVFFAFWYLIFVSNGFTVATAQSVSTNVFSVNPTVNYVLITILGPLAEDIFFFGILNITLVQIVRNVMKDRVKGLVSAGAIFATFPLFQNVPNSFMLITGSATIVALGTILQNKKLAPHLAFFATALFVGAAIFPKFHSYAYRLNENHYISASWFGFFMCILTSYVGLIPVDFAHILNNMIVVG